MLHEPAAQSGPDHAADYKKRLGVWMFIPYALIYAGFVFINLVRPVAMEKTCLSGPESGGGLRVRPHPAGAGPGAHLQLPLRPAGEDRYYTSGVRKGGQ